MNFRDVKVKVKATKVVKKDNYSLVLLRDSRHNKKTDKWFPSPYPNVHFAMEAHNNIDSLIEAIDNADKFEDGNSKGVYIVLTNVSLTNESFKNDKGETIYPKQLSVWSWEFPEETSSLDNPPVVEEEVESEEDEENPF
jgi:hypothetical protein